MPEDFKRFSIKVWQEGKYFDLWLVNHLLAGSIMGALVFLFNINLWLGFLFTLVLMLSWEAAEIIFNLQEDKLNRFLDVLSGTIGFLIMYFLSPLIGQSTLIVLQIMTGTWTILEIWGFSTYRFQKSDNQKVGV